MLQESFEDRSDPYARRVALTEAVETLRRLEDEGANTLQISLATMRMRAALADLNTPVTFSD